MEGILKTFPSTSAFHHNHRCLNTMQGFVAAHKPQGSTYSEWPVMTFLLVVLCRSNLRQGKDPAQEASEFWVPGCFQLGALFKYQNAFYVCAGKTPAVLYVAQMNYLLQTWHLP